MPYSASQRDLAPAQAREGHREYAANRPSVPCLRRVMPQRQEAPSTPSAPARGKEEVGPRPDGRATIRRIVHSHKWRSCIYPCSAEGGRATVWLLWLFLLAGPVIIGIGIREAALQRRLLREGIRTDGVVVRHRATHSVGNKPVYFAVLNFVDETGSGHEFESKLSGVKGPSVNSRAPVLYLPGRPKSARLDLSSKRIGGAVLVFGIGIVWTAAPIWLLFGGR